MIEQWHDKKSTSSNRDYVENFIAAGGLLGKAAAALCVYFLLPMAILSLPAAVFYVVAVNIPDPLIMPALIVLAIVIAWSLYVTFSKG